MISAVDFIRLPFTPDLTESGISFAKRSLAQNNDHNTGSVFALLRQRVSNVAIELAFRRHLAENLIPFDVKGNLPFSEPDRYDVLLGGRRCSIHTYLTSRRSQIAEVRQNPSVLLEAPAMIPEEELSANQNGNNLQLFTFLLGLTTNSTGDMQKAVNANQPIYLIHPMPTSWAQPQAWSALGKLGLKSEGSTPVEVEIGGHDADRNFVSEELTLSSMKRSFATNNYYSLAYIHIKNIPGGRVGIHSPNKDETAIIQPHQWDNVWVYGMEIWLTGYMPQDEFRRKASTTFSGSRVFQYCKTQTKNLSVAVAELRPLKDLFEQVKNWELEKKNW